MKPADHDFPRILLMSDYPPDERHGGGGLLRHLVGELPEGSVSWFSSRPLRYGKMPEGLEGVPFECADFTWRRPNRFGLFHWREYINLRWLALLQARKAALFGIKHAVDAVWAVMQEQVIVSGPAAARLLGVPYHASVHDVPSYLLRGRLGERKLRWFESVLKANYSSAASRDVIWEPMRSFYRETTGSDSILVTEGLEGAEEALAKPVQRPSGSPLKILHTGMAYDAEQLKSFILGLEDGVKAGRFPPFEFRLSGSEDFKPRMSSWPASARWIGWIKDEDLASTMEQADLFYLQHPFDEGVRDFARTSFPAKLPGYLRARRPIVFHAPDYSSIAGFARAHKLPFLITARDGAKAAEQLGEMLKTVPSAAGWAAGYDDAVRAFDWNRTAERFCQAMRQLPTSES